jgi:hypothetical protein
MTSANPVFLVPHSLHRFTVCMENVQHMPYDPHGFTLHELGQRLQHGGETTKWLSQWGLKITKLRESKFGTYYELEVENASF